MKYIDGVAEQTPEGTKQQIASRYQENPFRLEIGPSLQAAMGAKAGVLSLPDLTAGALRKTEVGDRSDWLQERYDIVRKKTRSVTKDLINVGYRPSEGPMYSSESSVRTLESVKSLLDQYPEFDADKKMRTEIGNLRNSYKWDSPYYNREYVSKREDAFKQTVIDLRYWLECIERQSQRYLQPSASEKPLEIAASPTPTPLEIGHPREIHVRTNDGKTTVLIATSGQTMRHRINGVGTFISTPMDSTSAEGFDWSIEYVSAGTTVTIDAINPRAQALATRAVGELKLRRASANGVLFYTCDGYSGRYFAQPDGSIFYEGGEGPNKKKLLPQTYYAGMDIKDGQFSPSRQGKPIEVAGVWKQDSEHRKPYEEKKSSGRFILSIGKNAQAA